MGKPLIEVLIENGLLDEEDITPLLDFLSCDDMPNPTPKTDHLACHQIKTKGDKPLSGNGIYTRHHLDVHTALMQMKERGEDHQAFIRLAVAEKLRSMQK